MNTLDMIVAGVGLSVIIGVFVMLKVIRNQAGEQTQRNKQLTNAIHRSKIDHNGTIDWSD